VLDVMLPRMSGLEISMRLRRLGVRAPILMLTARDAVEDRVAGLDAGADDYLVKPFAMVELLARVRALLRRHADLDHGGELRVADLVLDRVRHEARRGERRTELTAREFTLLEYLMRNEGRVLSRDQIIGAVWPEGFEGGTNVVDTYVHYLRAKIDKAPGHAADPHRARLRLHPGIADALLPRPRPARRLEHRGLLARARWPPWAPRPSASCARATRRPSSASCASAPRARSCACYARSTRRAKRTTRARRTRRTRSTSEALDLGEASDLLVSLGAGRRRRRAARPAAAARPTSEPSPRRCAGKRRSPSSIVDGVSFRVLTVPARHEGAVVGAVQVAKPLVEERQKLVQTLLDAAPDRRAGLPRRRGRRASSSPVARCSPSVEAFERQRRFIADASHELRTPVAVLRGRAELLRREHPGLPAPVLGELDALERDAERAQPAARGAARSRAPRRG
jgi:DNA-binding response OmpR family regulator